MNSPPRISDRFKCRMIESRADFHFSAVGFSFLQVGENFFNVGSSNRQVLIRTADDLEILEGDSGLKIMTESFLDLVGNNVFDIDGECGNQAAKQSTAIIQYRKSNSRCQHLTAELPGSTGRSFPAEQGTVYQFEGNHRLPFSESRVRKAAQFKELTRCPTVQACEYSSLRINKSSTIEVWKRLLNAFQNSGKLARIFLLQIVFDLWLCRG